ncbi:retrovirus-related pol polyprotein from transposon TNT 1-94 [Tanacetum coccineum]
MNNYLDILERLGYAMPNELGVSLILNSLNKDYDQFVQNYNMHSIGKSIVELHAMLKLYEKGIPKKAETPAVLAIREGKIQKDKKKPQGAKVKDKGKNKLAYAPKPKIPLPPKRDNPTKDSVCHHYKEVGHWKRNCPSYQVELKKRKNTRIASTSCIFSIELYAFPNMTWVYDTGCGTHICNTSVSEMRNRTLLDMVQSMMNLTTLPKSFWGYAPESVVRILNMVPTKNVKRMPYEIWHKKAPKLSYIRPMVQEASGSHGLLKLSGSDEGLELIQEEDTQPSENTSKVHNEVAPIVVEPQNVKVLIRRSARIPQAPDRYEFYVDVEEYELGDLNEPPMMPNGNALQKCILEGPYTPTTVVVLAVPAIENSPAVPEQTTVETVLNMSPANKAHFESEKEAIHLILTRIGDKIYSTVDACKIAHEMWEAIKMLQQEVNELCAKRIAKNANPLALVATAQPCQDPYYQTSKSYKSFAPTSKALILTRTHATIRHKGKEIAKPITPPSESASDEDRDPEQAQGIRKCKKFWLSLQSTSRNSTNLPTTTLEIPQTPETSGQVVHQSKIQCFNCKEFGHFAKEFRKPKRVKESTYHKEKMLLCKQDEQGVPLQAEQFDWLADMDEEIDEQELEAHYSYMAKIQEVPNADSGTNSEPLEQIQKQLKKANTTLAHELTKCKSILAETSRTLEESNSIWDSCLVALQNKQTKLEKYKTFNDRTVHYEKLEHKLNETLGLLAQKDIDIKEGLKFKAYEISIVQEKQDELVKQNLLTKSHYEGLVKEKTKAQNEKPCLYEIPHDQSDPANRLIPDRDEILTLEEESRSKLNKDLVKPFDYTKLNIKHSNDHLHLRAPTAHDMEILIKSCLMPLALKTQNDSFAFVHEFKHEMHADLKYVESLKNEIDELKSDKAEFSNMYDMLLQECVSNDVMCSYLHSLSDLDAHTELKCLYLHKVKEYLEVAFRKSTCFVRDLQGNDLLTGNRGSDLYTISLQEMTSSTPICLMAKASPTQA